eukprot:SAG25_NODE_345_length_9393_cov_4.870468_4_plen_135_part_00
MALLALALALALVLQPASNKERLSRQRAVSNKEPMTTRTCLVHSACRSTGRVLVRLSRAPPRGGAHAARVGGARGAERLGARRQLRPATAAHTAFEWPVAPPMVVAKWESATQPPPRSVSRPGPCTKHWLFQAR